MKSFLSKIKTVTKISLRHVLRILRSSVFYAPNKCNKSIVIVSNDTTEFIINEIKSRLVFYTPSVKDAFVSTQANVPAYSLFRGDSVLIYKKMSEFKRSMLSLFNNVFFVDHRFYISAWDWIDFANYYCDYVPDLEKSKNTLSRAIGRSHRDNTPAYIFGTGPSLAKAFEHSFSDGNCIVCNTIVRDKSLFDKLHPQFIVAGDAAYHFSFAEFAKAFRRDLHKCLRETGVYFVYPAKFDVLVQREFFDVSDKLIPIPIGSHKNINVNLLETFQLPSLGNVLPLLQLPLACTISKNVYLWGFDGRSPKDDVSPFWANSEKHSYPELMSTLKSAFPYFFDFFVPNNKSSNYIKSVHGDLLDERLIAAESIGYEFVMLHPSWTHTFAKRYRGSVLRDEYYGIEGFSHD